MTETTTTRHMIGSLGLEGTDHVASCTCGWSATRCTPTGANTAADLHLSSVRVAS